MLYPRVQAHGNSFLDADALVTTTARGDEQVAVRAEGEANDPPPRGQWCWWWTWPVDVSYSLTKASTGFGSPWVRPLASIEVAARS